MIPPPTAPRQEGSAIRWARAGVGEVTVAQPERPFALERGGALRDVTIAFETWGTRNAEGSNVVLVCPCLTADAHVTRRGPEDRPGWWESLVGAGRAIDPERDFVVCCALLGGCGGSTGPTTPDRDTGKPPGQTFPAITIGDIVRSQALVLDALGITTPITVIGGSIGGFQALEWPRAFPDRVAHAIVMAAGARLSPFGIAFNAVARHAIESDTSPDRHRGLALARQIGHLTYRSASAFERRFQRQGSSPAAEVSAYMRSRGQSFVRRFDADAYLRLIDAMDRFDLGEDADALSTSLSSIRAAVTLIGISSDWLFPPEQTLGLARALVAAGVATTRTIIQSDEGHDAFLLPHQEIDDAVRDRA